MKYRTMLRNWAVSSVLTFLLYEVIWLITSHSILCEWQVYATDLLYCAVFVLSSMTMCNVLSRIRYFKRIDFWSQTILCAVTLSANLLLAFAFEWIYNNILEINDWALLQNSLYIFCLVATMFTLVHHTSRYFRIILSQKDELAAMQKKLLKSKLDPHFVFNSLSTLTELIHESPQDAEQYTIHLSRIYRHLLSTLETGYVTLQESLKLVDDYVALQKHSVNGNIVIKTDIPNEVMDRFLFPLSLQMLVENAIKHNDTPKGTTLIISISVSDGCWLAVGNLKTGSTGCNSTGIGLETLRKRYRLENLLEPIITETGNYYEVKIRMID